MPDDPALRNPTAPPIPGPLVTVIGKHAGTLIGRAGEAFYRIGITRQNKKFDQGRGVTRLPVPVVSVGNLSVGGTGKTPMVMKLVNALLTRGRHPAIAMRGYSKGGRSVGWPGGPRRSSSGGPPIPDQRKQKMETSIRGSDEADLYRRMLPGVPVAAQPDRIAGLRDLLASSASGKVDCVVLDDGFQHRRLARDLDIVLIDASRDVFADRLLPAGWLREPVSSLGRAGVVVVTHAELVSEAALMEMSARVRAVNAGAVVCVARHLWTSLNGENFDKTGAAANTGDTTGDTPVSWLADKHVMAVCAIGNPAGFIAGVKRHAGRVVGQLVLPDHDPYSSRTIKKIVRMARASGAGAVVTTEKDWSKLGGRAIDWPCMVVRPVLEMEFVSGWEELMERVEQASERR